MALWFRFAASGGIWSAYLVPPSHVHLRRKPPAEPYCGRAVFAERSVYINNTLSEHDQNVTALHEIAHAVLRGARIPLGIEERVLHKLDERLLPVITDLGFRLPPRRQRRRTKR